MDVLFLAISLLFSPLNEAFGQEACFRLEGVRMECAPSNPVCNLKCSDFNLSEHLKCESFWSCGDRGERCQGTQEPSCPDPSSYYSCEKPQLCTGQQCSATGTKPVVCNEASSLAYNEGSKFGPCCACEGKRKLECSGDTFVPLYSSKQVSSIVRRTVTETTDECLEFEPCTPTEAKPTCSNTCRRYREVKKCVTSCQAGIDSECISGVVRTGSRVPVAGTNEDGCDAIFCGFQTLQEPVPAPNGSGGIFIQDCSSRLQCDPAIYQPITTEGPCS